MKDTTSGTRASLTKLKQGICAGKMMLDNNNNNKPNAAPGDTTLCLLSTYKSACVPPCLPCVSLFIMICHKVTK